MPQFVLAYHGGNKPESPEAGAAHFAKWQAWLTDLGPAVVNPGTPLGKSKTVSANGVTDDGGPNPLGGFTIVEADDMDAAIKIAQACPFLETEGTLEVAQIMEMK